MNSVKIYRSLCDRGRTRNKVRGSNLERHHIIPTFFFKSSTRKTRYNDGIYDGDGEHVGNISFLTPREHFIAHLLLCKIWRKTKWEYRCFTSVKMFLMGGKINDNRSIFEYNSRTIEKYKIAVNAGLSRGKVGTMPAKVMATGERLGLVSTTHPKVICGEWGHVTKGITKTAEYRESRKLLGAGFNNNNSKFSDSDLLLSYTKCCFAYGILVNRSLWVIYCERENLPHVKCFKQFRFEGRGYNGMVEDLLHLAAKQDVQLEHNINYKSHEWKSFIKKEKETHGNQNRKNYV